MWQLRGPIVYEPCRYTSLASWMLDKSRERRNRSRRNRFAGYRANLRPAARHFRYRLKLATQMLPRITRRFAMHLRAVLFKNLVALVEMFERGTCSS